MLMDASEFLAFKEIMSECEKLAVEFGIALTDVIQLRQLLCLRWLVQNRCNQQSGQEPIVK